MICALCDGYWIHRLQMIHFITFALGGEGYLNFMGNEVCYQHNCPLSSFFSSVNVVIGG